ncbi:MAG TPA: protocatechuate 3,4-dioxygenase subunit beta [Rhodobacteraceae bacterium]|nr:protocatechuate 3,4-dioxygenase subunit beta [Amylibacter sp.]MDG1235451.1 protocatechuate 3,4-dioxygenase subunit beta [Amylibacter sp.]MDG1997520.1 protocatechuate 3,4-dioxygenase subunit beta [Amylibacter sp.]HAD27771.1 protocatechuate 3,4-dioxygenase subunit beta [Paracoccaceae bacterium]|tara:strand:- start:388 stop:1125 length:738 start_codon:yes stop_codon:yes gene_type:complete
MSLIKKQGGFIARDRNRQPDAYTPEYKSSVKRSPNAALVSFPSSISEETAPMFGHSMLGELDNDLIHNYARAGESAIGPRIIVHGRVLDEHGNGVPNTLVEVWQANAGGRYRHKKESYIAPLDPNFGGCGRTITDEDGSYELLTIQPGAYPWPNRANDWRPAHIHFSLFGSGFAQRLITQMYFEGDPLIKLCPIVGVLKSQQSVDALTALLDMKHTVPMDSLAYKFDMVLRGRRQTYFENRNEGK